MKFDVVFVLYNSQKWIKDCLESIENSNYDLKKINLYFADNCSTDNSSEIVREYIEKKKSKYGNMNIIKLNKNVGFGRGNNKASKLGNSEYILFLNIDTKILPNTFSDLEKEIKKADDSVGMFELSQMPYEHHKYYNPLTQETEWASGACMVVKRKIFEKCHGFDKNLFMYCEDVELSFHFRMLGYKIKYLPNVSIYHYCYKYPGEEKPVAKFWTPANNFYLRCKYGNLVDKLKGIRLNKRFIHNLPLKEKRFVTIKFVKMSFAYVKTLFFKKNKRFNPKFLNYEYTDSRVGYFYERKIIEDGPLVSIIIRTHNRPKALREALISLRNQTYKNFEVCIVEDGKDSCSKMLKEEFSDLNINYKATGKHVGRCEVANLGMRMSKGKYLNFLDDDDMFFADHIYVLVSELEENNYNSAFTLAMEEAIIFTDKDDYKYNVKRRTILPCKYFKQTDIFKYNCFPIQSVMFRKDLLSKMIDGGKFDTNLDGLEDWDFWLRMGLIDGFNYVDKVTSVYRIPADGEAYYIRKKEIEKYKKYIYKKYQNKNISIKVEHIMNMRDL